MGGEINIHSIRALERQINEGNGDVIELKRTRNSLLNISTCTPPEVLGRIFVWSLLRPVWHPTQCQDFAGLQKGSYNFLLVCHRWFEVASRTPELWGFWGNTLQDWKKRYQRSRAATPLDLVLYGNASDPAILFDEPLQDALRSRVVLDTIRQAHLMSHDCRILTSIISSLTPDDKSGRNESIESIILGSGGFTSVDASNFFARSHLSRLCLLNLTGRIRISSWDHLPSRTTLLTVLSLKIRTSPPPPTITPSQLFSILAKNPNLEELTLSDVALPNFTDTSTLKVPLRSLKRLSLAGKFRQLFGLLNRLILPETLDMIDLTGGGSTAEDVSQTLAPYMREHFQRDPKFQNLLEVAFSSFPGSISISVNVVTALDPPHTAFNVHPTDGFPPDVREQLFIDLFESIPQERVAFLNADLDLKLSEELFIMMPNIAILTLSGVELYEGFLQPNPNGPYADEKLLPSLEVLCLEDVFPVNGDWSPLTTYLVHQTMDNQTVSLEMVSDFPYMRPEVVNEIEDLVEAFHLREGVRMEDEQRLG